MASLEFSTPRFIYHMCLEAEWRAAGAAGYLPAAHAADGFIHCASIPQSLVAIGNRFYKGTEGAWICLVVDTQRLRAGTTVKWEPAAPVGAIQGADHPTYMLPHVYGGPLTTEEVVAERAVTRAADGAFVSVDGVPATPCDAVVWDCDGTLIDTEPLWVRVEAEVFRSLGMPFEESDAAATTGLRIDAVVSHWAATRGWSDMDAPDRTPAAVTARIVDTMEAAIKTDGKPMPGVLAAVELCARMGARVAVASSSPHRLIEAALGALGIRDRFEHVLSAENEEFGKPHPAVYLSAAKALGVPPTRCLAVEDSVNGVLAAKAARMRVIAVPELPPGEPPRRQFGIADAVLGSLEALDEVAFNAACSLG